MDNVTTSADAETLSGMLESQADRVVRARKRHPDGFKEQVLLTPYEARRIAALLRRMRRALHEGDEDGEA